MARVGILTGGGDCPGLNAVIRAVVRRGVLEAGDSVVGFRYGWAGVMQGDAFELTLENTRGILPRGGTILGTSRTNPYKEDGGAEQVVEVLDAHGVDALIAVGGEDTLGVARRLAEDGANVVGVPKTIDNDLNGTDFTFGFHTAVQIATDAIDRLHSTAESHNRVMVVEVMGRHAGWIATYSGHGRRGRRHPRARAPVRPRRGVPAHPAPPRRGADVLDHRRVRGRHAAGRRWPALRTELDEFGHARLGGIAVELERQIEERTGFESRMTILGHVQRGGTPTAYDRVLATRFGVAALDAVSDGAFGQMVALHAADIVRVPLAEALREPKLLDPALYETAEVFFG